MRNARIFGPLAAVALWGLLAGTAGAFDAEAERNRMREKYPDALERCSVFEMMDKAKAFQEIDAEQDRTVEAEDWGAFERVARAGIALKTQPEIWYYNLACALSRQGKIAEALTALEQSGAAGYRDRRHAEEDGDLENLRKEARYTELLDVMSVNFRLSSPKPPITVQNGRFMPTEATTDCSTTIHDEYFVADLAITPDRCPLVFMDRNQPVEGVHADADPNLGVIQMDYPAEMVKLGQDWGTANFAFRFANGKGWVPTLAVSDVTGGTYPGRSLFGESVLADHLFSLDGLCERNVLQLYAAGIDYGVDGLDRYLANIPLAVNYVGGKKEQEFFVRAIVGAIRALPARVRDEATAKGILVDVVQKLLRMSQKNVKGTDDFLTGAAHPPAFFADNIDMGLLLERSARMVRLPPPRPTPLIVKERQGLPLNELENPDCHSGVREALRVFYVSASTRGYALAFRGLVQTLRFKATSADEEKQDAGELVVRVLQGDADKVRIKPTEDGNAVDVEVDYHPVFEVEDAHGRKMRTTRVDIGFFRKVGDDYSMPHIVSVAFPPHDTRTYDGNGRLLVADYSRPQIAPTTNFVASAFTHGSWRDTYRYSDKGDFLGWTRDSPGKEGPGVEWTVEWTDAYMAVVERDEQGRPTRLVRPRTYAWKQERPMDDKVYGALRGIQQQNSWKDFPAVSWICTYASTNDVKGMVKRIPYQAYWPRRFNRYADFGTATNGFSYPLSFELEDGLNLYRLSAYGTYLTNQELANLKRGTGQRVPMSTPPKKMRFTPRDRSATDALPLPWPDLSDVEHAFATNLVRIPDGAYRFRRMDGDGEATLVSIQGTSRMWNDRMGEVATRRMDALGFPRCTVRELEVALEQIKDEEFASNCTAYVQGTDAAFVEARAKAITGWRLRDNVCLIMSSDGTVGAGMYAGKPRTYCFARIDTNQVDNTHSLLNLCWTFPTVDMMQTFFRALGRQEEAENDLAVLRYSGAVNFFSYDEKWVLDLLNRAARKHLPTAFHNLGVFYDNRKEARRAQTYYRLAEQIQRHTDYANVFTEVYGETNIIGWVQYLEREVKAERPEAYSELALERMHAANACTDDEARKAALTAEIVSLARRGGELGDLMAMGLLARMGGVIGETNAVAWARTAVETGFATASTHRALARAYRRGAGGLAVNARKAFELLFHAALELGDAEAQFELAQCFRQGDVPGGKKNLEVALELYERAARQGLLPARKALEELTRPDNAEENATGEGQEREKKHGKVHP